MTDMTTGQVASAVGVSARRVTELLRGGLLGGRQLADGTWLVDSAAVNQFQRVRAQRAGRTWSATAAWALLAELGDDDLVDGVSRNLRSRTRARIRAHDAAALARLVARRTKWRRYTADNAADVAKRLVLTGVSAGHLLSANLAEQGRIVQGYVAADSLGSFVHDNWLVEDANGSIVIGTYPQGVALGGAVAPNAVIAADLALAASTRDRSAGLSVLEGLRQSWLARDTA